MKTTLILKDELVREAKSRAALQGCSMSKYVEACLQKSFSSPPEHKRKIGMLPGLIKRMGDDFNESFEDWSDELEPQ